MNGRDSYEFEELGEGRFSLSGTMGFRTADQILREAEGLFEEHTRIEVDLGGVDRTDSAGLALLLEWITWANHTVREIRFQNMPDKIRAIAAVTEVEDLLKRGERWSGFIEAPASAGEPQEAEEKS